MASYTRKMNQAAQAAQAANEALYSAGVFGAFYIYTNKRGDNQVSVKVKDNGVGVEIQDSKYGFISESNYQVFKALYPAIAKHFLRKTRWNR